MYEWTNERMNEWKPRQSRDRFNLARLIITLYLKLSPVIFGAAACRRRRRRRSVLSATAAAGTALVELRL